MSLKAREPRAGSSSYNYSAQPSRSDQYLGKSSLTVNQEWRPDQNGLHCTQSNPPQALEICTKMHAMCVSGRHAHVCVCACVFLNACAHICVCMCGGERRGECTICKLSLSSKVQVPGACSGWFQLMVAKPALLEAGAFPLALQ